MQIKKLILIITVLIFLSAAGLTAALALTSLPVSLLQGALKLYGHEALGFDLVTHSFKHREIKIEWLHLKDESKEVQIKNLALEIKDSQIINLTADLISFRDLTKPNQSLQKLLEQWPTPNPSSSPLCIENLHIGNLSMALSYSGEATKMALKGQQLCVGEDIHFKDLSIESDSVTLTEKNLLWQIGHQHFYDLPKDTFIELARDGNALKLAVANRNSLLRLIKQQH